MCLSKYGIIIRFFPGLITKYLCQMYTNTLKKLNTRKNVLKRNKTYI